MKRLSFAAHTADDSELVERLLVVDAGVLRTAIGMVQESRVRHSPSDGDAQGLEDELAVDALTHGNVVLLLVAAGVGGLTRASCASYFDWM